MKTLLATTAIVMAGSLPVLAEQHAMSPFVDSAEVEANADLRASELIGMRVYTSETEVGNDGMADADTDWDDIGEISDVILSKTGDMEAVLLDVGGFLGIGERTVAVNLSDLNMVSDSDDADDFFIVLQSDRETVENAPEFDTDVIGAWNMSDEQAMSEDTTEDTPDMTAGSTADDTAAPTAGVLGGADATAGDDMAEAPAATDDTMAPTTAAPEGDMTDTEGEAMTGEEGPMVGYSAVDSANMTAEQLDGARIYDSNDEWIGEISNAVVAEDGTINEVIVDVGGFLGIGEKSVALPFDELKLMQQDEGDDIRALVTSTKDELESMPEYEE